jgi:hypothetical protein
LYKQLPAHGIVCRPFTPYEENQEQIAQVEMAIKGIFSIEIRNLNR